MLLLRVGRDRAGAKVARGGLKSDAGTCSMVLPTKLRQLLHCNMTMCVFESPFDAVPNISSPSPLGDAQARLQTAQRAPEPAAGGWTQIMYGWAAVSHNMNTWRLSEDIRRQQGAVQPAPPGRHIEQHPLPGRPIFSTARHKHTHLSLGATRLRRDLTKSSAACADHLQSAMTCSTSCEADEWPEDPGSRQCKAGQAATAVNKAPACRQAGSQQMDRAGRAACLPQTTHLFLRMR